jgi:hypothetical protein
VITERGPRRTGQGILWLLFLVVPLLGVWISSFFGGLGTVVGVVVFLALAFVIATKAWAAFTGARKVNLTEQR